jgi:hypothetical protein
MNARPRARNQKRSRSRSQKRSRSRARKTQRSRPRSQRRLVGGAAVAQGSVGCLFSPALRCVGSTTRRNGFVTKLVRAHVADREIKISRIILSLRLSPASLEHFILPQEPCTPAALTDEDLVDSELYCSAPLKREAEHLNDNLTNLKALDAMDGGQTLQALTASTFLSRNQARQIHFVSFSESMIRLLHAIQELNQKGVVHYDIKDNNVVYRDGTVRLIDWDRAFFYRDWTVTRDLMQHFQSLVQQPLAYAFLCRNALIEIDTAEASNLTAEQLLESLMRIANLGVHVYARNLIAAYARVTPGEAVRDQVGAILSRFYVNHKFDWDGYVALLRANYDVYGWLAVNSVCWARHEMIFNHFPGQGLLSIDDAFETQAASFFRTYMFSPQVLVEHYKVDTMLNEFQKLIHFTAGAPNAGGAGAGAGVGAVALSGQWTTSDSDKSPSSPFFPTLRNVRRPRDALVSHQDRSPPARTPPAWTSTPARTPPAGTLTPVRTPPQLKRKR